MMKTMLKAAVVIVCALFFAVFAFTLRTSVNAGNFGGMLLCLFFAAAVIFSAPLRELMQHSRPLKVIGIVCAVLVSAGALTAAVVSVRMIQYFDRPCPDDDATVLVLGCRVGSPMLNKRINAAYKYLSEHPDAVCIASGGQGADEPMSEAEYIRGKLADMGIADDRIITEDGSTSTLTNMQYSKKILDGRGMPQRVVLVTSEYHQLRAAMMARFAGLEPYSVSSYTEFLYLPTCWLREICAVLVSLVIYR